MSFLGSIFLQTFSTENAGVGSASAESIAAMGAAFLAIFGILSIALYVYMSFAFMTIGKKAKVSSPGLAWIPGIGPMIIAYKASGMHWWPWLLLIGIIIPFINIIALLVFAVFTIIWQWKMFEAVNKAGWWALIPLIPLIGGLIYLVLIGIAAWSEDNSVQNTQGIPQQQ